MSTRMTRAALGAAVAVASVAVAAPAHADTTRPSARVQLKLRAAERALGKAGDAIDDGNSASAVSRLAAVRRDVAAAQKTALRTKTASSLGAVAAAEGDIVSETVAMYDELTGDPVTAVSTTLKAALDGRDAIVAAIGSDTSYSNVLGRIADDASSEASDVSDTLTDDTLTDDAKTALNGAATQLAAAVTAAGGTTGSSTSGDASDASDPGAGDTPCSQGGGQQGGGGGPRV
jgi:hypothetical protein